MGKSSHWRGGIVGIFIVAIIIFLSLFFFVPEVSQRFFGVSFGEVDDIAEAIISYLDYESEGAEELKEFLSSDSGKDVIKDITKKGSEEISDVMKNPAVIDIFSQAVEYAEAGLGSVEEYISDHIDELEDLI